jgi:amidohydrolase
MSEGGLRAIDDKRADLIEMSHLLAAEPELAWEEHKSHDRLAGLCERLGFSVTRHFKEIATSFEARFTNGDGPVVAFCCEYDALPGIGGQVRHACGHNEIAISAIAAAIGVKHALQSGHMTGTVIVMGTPAEETTGGKINLVNAGAFKGVDFSMMVHPTKETKAYTEALAMWEVFATFTGKNAHAAGEPHLGINALDAGVQAYVNISTLRQQLKPECRVHGIFKEGGLRPNIIPDRCVLHYYVRAPDKVELFSLIARVTKCFEAAALATGCTVSLEWPAEPFLDIQSNSVLADLWGKHWEQLTGTKLPSRFEDSEGLGSTDMGNVTYEVPGLHPCYSITTGSGCHTAGFADAAVTEHAHNQTLFAAKSMFLAALDVMTDNALLGKMKAEFAELKARIAAAEEKRKQQ